MTIFEMLVAVSIFLMITTLVVSNFARGRNADMLRAETNALRQNIRNVQNMAMTGSGQPDGTPMPIGGYGIYISDASTYTLFADNNSNQLRDAGEDFKTVALQGNVTISPVNLSIAFIPPKPTVCVNADCNIAETTLTLSHPKVSPARNIVFNTISGQVSIE